MTRNMSIRYLGRRGKRLGYGRSYPCVKSFQAPSGISRATPGGTLCCSNLVRIRDLFLNIFHGSSPAVVACQDRHTSTISPLYMPALEYRVLNVELEARGTSCWETWALGIPYPNRSRSVYFSVLELWPNLGRLRTITRPHIYKHLSCRIWNLDCVKIIT